MSDEPHAQSAGPTVPCKFCKLPIPRDARYCTRCEKFQGLWDRLQWGASVSALISLISVGTLAYGFIAQQIKKTEPQVVLTPVACSVDTVKVALSNLGDQPALFQGGTISLPPGGPALTRSLVGDAVPSLLPAQSNKIAALQLADPTSHLPLPFQASAMQVPGCQFKLDLAWTDGHNRRHNDGVTCACGT